ncbi:MAG: SpvB/TcaC N-terminal domain-containing protein, partial [bacterium]
MKKLFKKKKKLVLIQLPICFLAVSMIFGGSVSADIFPQNQYGAKFNQVSESKINIQAGAATGAFNFSYDFTIPPGRNNMQPNLSLSYSSQNSEGGIYGYGWSLSIPYIQRINKKGSEKMYTENDFFSSLGG